MEMELIEVGNGIGITLAIVVLAIVVDATLGVIRAVLEKEFDFRRLPQFLGTGVLPYVGGIGILATAALLVGDPFKAIFYAAAATVATKYVADIKDKMQQVFKVQIKSDDYLKTMEK